MNPSIIIPSDNASIRTLIALQVVSILGAGIFLYISRFFPIALLPSIVFLGVGVFLACYSRHWLISLVLIGVFTSLILSLRFDYLTWGDSWAEYGMIRQILAYQSLNPSVYPEQLPVMHAIIATISLFSGINPLDLLKYIIPPLSVMGLYAVYRFTKDISSTETAFFAGLLLLCGTPYLHWTTQCVRETIGIALFVLTLYVSFTAIQSHKKQYLFLSLLLVGGLVLTHHLSSMIFLITWVSVSLSFLYLICDMNRIRTTGLFSLLIALAAVIMMVGWWIGRLEYQITEFNRLMNSIYHSELGIVFFILSLILVYSLPLIIPDKILILRSIVNRILVRRNIICTVFIIGTLVSSAIVLNFVMGESSFVLSYPLPMFFNGICMIILSLIGLYYFLEIDRLHIVAWASVLALVLVLSMSNMMSFIDPLRFMEFLYIPLAIIAAFGVSRIAKCLPLSKVFPFILAVFVIVSVITSFPSLVFLGNAYEPGHPFFDTRSLVIQHQPSEISASNWINDSHARGIIETDAYVGYAARGIILTNTINILSDPFQILSHVPSGTRVTPQQRYVLIISRMKEYTEFGTQWQQKKEPLNDADLVMINNECNILYANGNATVYSYKNGV